MESTQEQPAESPSTEVDVWSWTDAPPASLDLGEMLELRRQVLGRPAARRELVKRLGEADWSGGDADLRTGIGRWLTGDYRHAHPALDRDHRGDVGVFAYADALMFAGHLGLDGVEPRPRQAADALLAALPDNDAARVLALRALITCEDNEQARTLLDKQSASFKDSADGMFFEGHLAEIEGDYAAADAAYEKALELEPDHALTLFRLARWHDLSGEDDKAMEYYGRLTQDRAPHVNALVNLGVLHEDHGEYPEAAHCYRRVLAIYPQHPRANLYLKDVEASFDMYYDEEQEVRQDRKNQILKIPVSDFELSVRSRNCLAKMNIVTLGDLVAKTEAELLSYKNFGETSLNEIKQILEMKGLRLGMRPEDDLAPVATAAATGTGVTPGATVTAPPAFTIDPNDERLKKPVSELNLSVRARKCLANLNIKVIADLIAYTTDDLLGQRNFGVTSLKEIVEQVESMGLSMRTVDR